MARRAKENLPGGSLKYQFVYIRIFRCSYRSFEMIVNIGDLVKSCLWSYHCLYHITLHHHVCSFEHWRRFFCHLVGGLEHEFHFYIQLGISSSQLTNSIIFQRGRYTTNQLCF